MRAIPRAPPGVGIKRGREMYMHRDPRAKSSPFLLLRGQEEQPSELPKSLTQDLPAWKRACPSVRRGPISSYPETTRAQRLSTWAWNQTDLESNPAPAVY